MALTSAILFKGLVAALIVGFVTASIKSWVDRVFLVIMLVGIVGIPITSAIVVNLGVVALAALLMVFRQRKMLQRSIPGGSTEWYLVVIPAVAGGIGGRLLSVWLTPAFLIGALGVYAVLVGLRILVIKPLPERETKAHPAWMAPVSLGSGLLTGILSAGGKPFVVPLYNNAMGHHPQRAYAFASIGVVSAAFGGFVTQCVALGAPTGAELLLAVYEFALVTIVAMLVNKFWTERLNKIVNLIIAPILIVVGIRFIMMALA